MKKNIFYNKDTDEFVITLNVPRKMSGSYTYDEDNTWVQDAVCVWIDNSHYDYGLYNTQYLDYKDSLQATTPIIHFDSQKEAEEFAEKYKLMIEYGHGHRFGEDWDEDTYPPEATE